MPLGAESDTALWADSVEKVYSSSKLRFGNK
jgi:hypothetical protein